jgi:alkylated DNA repair dioxygenase AlkB
MSLFHDDVVELLPYDFGAILYSNVWDMEHSNQLMQRLSVDLQWEQVFVEVFNRRAPQPRLTCWYGDEGKSYSYSGTRLTPLPWTQLLIDIKQRTEEVAGVTFNSVLANLYRDGSDSVSWHADNEPELGTEPTIASVTFGATRRFDMRHRNSNEKVSIGLSSGSVLVMSGLSQARWQHQIAKTKKLIGPRINLTFRTIHV